MRSFFIAFSSGASQACQRVSKPDQRMTFITSLMHSTHMHTNGTQLTSVFCLF